MLAKVFSAVNRGLDSYPVEVEIDVARGFPSLEIVGLPDTAVKEAKERVRSAITNSGFKFLPGNKKRVVINLAPADVKKEGSVYDLPIAVALLVATEQIPVDFLTPLGEEAKKGDKALFVGELALDGRLRHTKGILPMALLAKKKGIKNIFLPAANAPEAGLVEGLKIYPLDSLVQFIKWIANRDEVEPIKSRGVDIKPKQDYEADFGYIKGQQFVKRGLEIAAAGGHNVLMIGPPGAGKTLLARALPSILPSMTREEILEVTKIYSVAGLLGENEFLKTQRPFRAPHHTVSNVALVGGGQVPSPGEVSLAHRGVLFLDELPEFSRRALETLRQPLEDGVILVSRARGSASYPAKFILVGAMNPCPCGYYGDPQKECKCSAQEIVRYRKKISGPFLDRVDLHMEVPRVKLEKLTSEKMAETSGEIRDRVERAREIQRKKFKGLNILTNSEISSRQIKKFCSLNKEGEKILKKAMESYSLSARSYHRILKMARTIADLEGKEQIDAGHIQEAVQYRTRLEKEDLF